jgi:hypothetical protein
MSRAYSVLVVASAVQVKPLLQAAPDYFEPVDHELSRLVSQPPVVDRHAEDRRLAIGHYWLMIPVGVAGPAGDDMADVLDAPLREVRGQLQVGGCWGAFGLILGARHLVARFAAESNHMSELLAQQCVQDRFRSLCQASRGVALLLQRDSIEWLDELTEPGVSRRVFWPEWHISKSPGGRIDSAVEALIARSSGD